MRTSMTTQRFPSLHFQTNINMRDNKPAWMFDYIENAKTASYPSALKFQFHFRNLGYSRLLYTLFSQKTPGRILSGNKPQLLSSLAVT
jgi:hypothetical protein